MVMDLHPTLEDILNDFLYCEMACVVYQAAELEVALKLHQALMKEVCHSIKAHNHWVRYGRPLSIFSSLQSLWGSHFPRV